VGQALSTEDKPKRSWLARMAILTFGWIFIILGILGLFLPILQGILFLAIGGMLLSMESPRAQRIMERLRNRYPTLDKTMLAAQKRTTSIVQRIRSRFG
jgi:uncharacterized membrane protein YbaN (DUF454 family)